MGQPLFLLLRNIIAESINLPIRSFGLKTYFVRTNKEGYVSSYVNLRSDEEQKTVIIEITRLSGMLQTSPDNP